MKVGVYQFSPAFGNVQSNLKAIGAALEQVHADLVVLPELCTTGYQFVSAREARSLAEPVPEGAAVRCLESICRARGMHLVAGIAEAAGGAVYNSAVLIGPAGWIGTYRKVHLFLDEKKWFTPGDTGFRVWDIGIARIGLMVCFDWIFPEAARDLALLGADLICHPANLVLPYCPDAMITRSIENRVFSITANRTGEETRDGADPLSFIGKSQAVGVRGELLFRMGESEEGVRFAEIDPRSARDKRLTPANDLFRDRRPDLYAPLVL
jgi:predicted amidohydrolase